MRTASAPPLRPSPDLTRPWDETRKRFPLTRAQKRRQYVYVNGALSAVVVGTASVEVESDYGLTTIAVVAVDTADNESLPGTVTVIH